MCSPTRRDAGDRTFSVDNRQSVGLDVIIAQCVYRSDVRHGWHGEVLARRVGLGRVPISLVRALDCGGSQTYLTADLGLILQREQVRDYKGLAFGRSSRKVALLRADLEEPQPPCLVKTRGLELGVIVRPKALFRYE